MNFLKQELEEKNLLIRTLIIKDSEIYYTQSTTDSESNSSHFIQENTSETSSIHTHSANEDIPGILVSEENAYQEISTTDVNDLDDEIDLNELYLEYVKDMEEENRERSRRKQLEDVLSNLLTKS